MTIPPEDIDALVRGHLDRAAECIDPRPAFDRLRDTISPPARRPSRRWAVGVLTAAACLLVAVTVTPPAAPAKVAPEILVREATEAQQLPLDRAYLVEVRKEGDDPAFPPIRPVRIWTRGDRFRVETTGPNGRTLWGRDEGGSVWIAFAPRVGLRLDADEVPAWLASHSDLLSMEPEKVLTDVLRRFKLAEEPPEPGSSSRVVTARPRLWHPAFRKVVLEIDTDTKVMRKLVLHRASMGKPTAVVTYTLVETQVQQDEAYELQTHLTRPFEVYTREHRPERRQWFLQRWYAALPGAKQAPKPRPFGEKK